VVPGQGGSCVVAKDGKVVATTSANRIDVDLSMSLAT
jgi:hypothetical protein